MEDLVHCEKEFTLSKMSSVFVLLKSMQSLNTFRYETEINVIILFT